ncbi:MAG TPA: hemolysin family protein [Candidatus Blautia pullicola]|uniref:Hemolysin family protein n=1 Tax=Candidatus Blautia pullicola TaxID=2838498 RepID=A0A9D2FS28_9FIRM|nr:hemolysin family protein [Candidatus Blautia pullicola]
MDDSTGPLWALIIFLIFIMMNGIMYGFGSAVQKINESEVEKKAEEGNRKATWLLKVMNHPFPIINTILSTATLLSLLTGYIGIRSITPYVYKGFTAGALKLGLQLPSWLLAGAAAVVVMVLALIILMSMGVIAAKKIFSSNPERWVYRTVGIVHFMVCIFMPLTFVISKVSNGVVRIFGVDPHRREEGVTEEEIISMVDDAHEKGVIEENEAEMIQNIIEFSETEAQDIMTHRKNINAVEEQTTLKEALLFMLNNSNSRYPVYREDLDNIVGILHLKDAMKQMTFSDCENLPIRSIPNLIREASYIPETRNINDLFKGMQAKKIHMSIVLDEYGQTLGLVTMEDILEEIVGNILDEYDEEEDFIQVQTDDSLIMEGLTPLEQVDQVLGSDFDETEEFETLNGYLTSLLGHVPNMSEDKEIRTKGFLFTILAVENNTIQKVRVEKLPMEEKGEETCQDIQNSQI